MSPCRESLLTLFSVTHGRLICSIGPKILSVPMSISGWRSIGFQESLAPCHQTHPGRVTSELWSGWTWKRSMEAAMVTTSMAFVSMETETCSGWLIRKACLLTNLNSTHTLLPWNAWNWGFEKEHSTRVRSPYSRAGISDPQQLGPKWKLKT